MVWAFKGDYVWTWTFIDLDVFGEFTITKMTNLDRIWTVLGHGEGCLKLIVFKNAQLK